jgi:hypothetical protein
LLLSPRSQSQSRVSVDSVVLERFNGKNSFWVKGINLQLGANLSLSHIVSSPVFGPHWHGNCTSWRPSESSLPSDNEFRLRHAQVSKNAELRLSAEFRQVRAIAERLMVIDGGDFNVPMIRNTARRCFGRCSVLSAHLIAAKCALREMSRPSASHHRSAKSSSRLEFDVRRT